MDTVAGFASIYEYSFVKAQSTNLINTPVCKHSETAWYVLVWDSVLRGTGCPAWEANDTAIPMLSPFDRAVAFLTLSGAYTLTKGKEPDFL